MTGHYASRAGISDNKHTSLEEVVSRWKSANDLLKIKIRELKVLNTSWKICVLGISDEHVNFYIYAHNVSF